jgi:cation diffusion facilitator CzcD-associated flavoprotein CzcO
VNATAQSSEPTILDIAIIGAGFSGIGMAIALKKAGYKAFRVFEKASDLGGTWRDNRYPGCACDVPSHLYGFSFEQNSLWSHSYASQAEIWRYMRHCAIKYDVLSHIHFDAPVEAARFDEKAHLWRVTLKSGETILARALITATGALHLPAYPKIEGLESFSGRTFHSSEWDGTLDLPNRKVGVIGTGASAIQIVPAIAAQVKELRVFQRTPPWVLPRMDRAFSERTQNLFRKLPVLQRMLRHVQYWGMEMRAIGFLGNRRYMANVEKLARRYLQKTIADPALRAALTPDYKIGCKRILISDDFYQTLERPNVELVTSPIERVVPSGLVTTDGRHHELDTLVFATGFRANEPFAEIEITGRNGHTLAHQWRYGAEAYYGMTVSGFPNFFMLLGPNTGLGHNSVLFMVEAQIRYIVHCLGWLFREEADEVEVKVDVQRAFNARLKAKLAGTVWQSGCRSWYLNENGTNSTIWPGFTFSYWWKTRNPDPHDFKFRIPKAAPLPSPFGEV